ncbi:hypothetical protein NPX13_g6436 [Xylaria arbuscula]|uniref:F-box domain-containing protein n=1 Tax=Xylaria arbuscula TaxID=114810 RepID=A0A9W8TLR8_9PEZI|nr:hypothetical protein NPX13_g6436 [Xylaria arbuscula]
MSPRLISIPPEILLSIVSYLLPPDQSSLARTCKTLNGLLTPLIWGDIELHYSGTHEGIDIEGEIDALEYEDPKERMANATADDPKYPYNRTVFKPSLRKYAQCHFNPSKWQKGFRSRSRKRDRHGRATDNCNRRNFQFGREEQFVRVQATTSRERWAQLAPLVCSLCMSIGVDDEVAKVLASFSNLRSLELVGLPLSRGRSLTAPDVKLPNLQNLKLRGYFTTDFVRKICDNAEHIKYLDLGLLASAKDDEPYKDNLLANDDNRGLVSEQEAEDYQKMDIGAATLAPQNNKKRDSVASPDADDEEADESDDDDDHDDEGTSDDDDMPWALHAPIWLPRSLPARFTELTHLHLVKAYTGETNSYLSHDKFEHIPHQYEQVVCLEWVALLQGVAPTLRELILEHRIPVEEGDTVGDGDLVPLVKGGNRNGRFNPFTRTNPDRGDVLFCRSVLRLLLEQSSRFPKLERLAFRGIQIKGICTQRGVVDVPGKDGVPDNDERLRELYPDCEIELFEDSYPIHVYAGYVYQSWPENRHEAMQDEGDGLMWNLAYYNDYKRRFGPQWHIKG